MLPHKLRMFCNTVQAVYIFMVSFIEVEQKNATSSYQRRPEESKQNTKFI